MIQDFDGGVVGETVQQVILTNFTGLPTQMTWTVVPASQFPGGVDDVANAVAQNQVWAALTGMFKYYYPHLTSYLYFHSFFLFVCGSESGRVE